MQSVFIAVRDFFGQLALKIVDVRFDVVALPHFNSEKMMVVPLSLSTRCVMREERFEHLFKVVGRSEGREYNQSKVTLFRLEEKVRHISRLLRELIIILSKK